MPDFEIQFPAERGCVRVETIRDAPTMLDAALDFESESLRPDWQVLHLRPIGDLDAWRQYTREEIIAEHRHRDKARKLRG